jgi:acyl-CoA reductase-like NAD-dependent aldehyde dehydrogenase
VFLVVVFTVAETVQEAIELANASEYSLAASLWTSNVFEGQQIAGLIRSGQYIIHPSYGDRSQHFSFWIGYTNINGPTIHSEAIDGLVGLG